MAVRVEPSGDPRVRRGREIELALLALLALGMAGVYYLCGQGETAVIGGQRLPTFWDDTYISMRYARHLAEGHGLVWNVGDPPLEGFTNFLWVLWIAALMTLFGEPSSAMLASTAALHITAVLLFYWLLRARYRVHWLAAGTATLLLAVWEPIRVQAFVAMEAPLLLCVFVAALALVSARADAWFARLAGALLAGMLPLVRPDGLFLTALLAVLFVATRGGHPDGVRDGRDGGGWYRAAVAACFLGPGILLTLFRLLYFHDLLPNTYYLKVIGRPGRIEYGLMYVGRFLKSFYGTWILAPLIVYAVLHRSVIALVATGGAVGVLAGVAYQGGDLGDSWRFFVPALPLVLIPFAMLATGWLTASFPLRALGIVTCLMVLYVGTQREIRLLVDGDFFPRPAQPAIDNIRLGMALKRVCSDRAVTADFWAGATPYFSGLRSVDMLGRSDAVIARTAARRRGGVPGHDKFDFDYVLGRKPDVIVVNHRLRTPRAELEVIRRGAFPFGVHLLDRLATDPAYVAVESVLSEAWHGLYARRVSRACDWGRLAGVERELGLSCFVTFTDGWHGLERHGRDWWRWNTGRGGLRLVSSVPRTVRMRGWLVAARTPDTADVVVGGVRRSGEGGIAIGRGKRAVDLVFPVIAGETRIEIEGRVPAAPLPTDARTLGIGVRNLGVEPGDGSPACLGLP
jgi:hypothetical protein